MAKKIKAADLKNLPVYMVVGENCASFSGESGGPKGAEDGAYYKAGDKDKHFKMAINPLSFDIEPVSNDRKTMKLKFDSPGSTENILYLPNHDDCITSIVIPTTLDKSVEYFITYNLSGCNIFIDKLQNGDLVCYHANAIRYSPQKSAVKENPAATSALAEGTMDALHKNAHKSEFPNSTSADYKRRLQASEYYEVPKGEVDRLPSKKKKEVQFYGGSTLMGFREKDGWEFWFQTYGKIKNAKKPNGEAEYKVFEAKRIWP